MKNAALIYPWDLAPEDYRDLSQHGGDEDLVVVIPNALRDSFEYYFSPYDDYHPQFGHCESFELDNCLILIYAHA